MYLILLQDYLDAFEKLMHLGLKNQLERELVHVTVYCCLHEKKYNPYYGLVLSKLCSEDRKYMVRVALEQYPNSSKLLRTGAVILIVISVYFSSSLFSTVYGTD